MSEFPRSLKLATVWLLVGVVVFVAVQAWQRQEQQTLFQVSGSSIEIRRGADGHYHWTGSINGHAVDFLVDTGATRSALSGPLADQLALPTLGQTSSQTAGGVVQGRIVLADLSLDGGVNVQRLPMVALPKLGDKPLLGMDVLGGLHLQQSQGVLRIDLRATR